MERGDTAEIILRCNQAGGKFLVLEGSRPMVQVAGTSWMTWDGRRVFLHHFAIDPLCRDRDMGEDWLLNPSPLPGRRNCPMKLEVHSQNTPAVNLYRSLGFEVFEDYDIYMIL